MRKPKWEQVADHFEHHGSIQLEKQPDGRLKLIVKIWSKDFDSIRAIQQLYPGEITKKPVYNELQIEWTDGKAKGFLRNVKKHLSLYANKNSAISAADSAMFWSQQEDTPRHRQIVAENLARLKENSSI